MSKVIKAGQSRAAPPVLVGRKDAPPAKAIPAGPEAAAAPPGAAALPAAQTDTANQKILEKAFSKAKQIVDSAQVYNMRQIQEARQKIAEEAADAKKRGYSDGYAQGAQKGKKDGSEAGRRAGYDAGLKNAEAENRKYTQELGEMIETVEKAKSKILQDFESDIQGLAVAMAKAILKKELEIDDKAMRSIIINAMDSYRNQSWVRIYVPNNTANVLLKADNNIVDALKDVSDNVKVVAANGMDDGGCVLEMPDQVIDAGINSQLKKIKSAIETAMKSGAK